jgi:predicted RNase H-like nuclease
VDTFLHSSPSLHHSIAEGHPELAFISLSTNKDPLPPKRTTEGQEKRIAILQNCLSKPLNDSIAQFRNKHSRDVDITDILDALALAALLHRSHGEAHFLGDGALDSFGAPCRICYR